MDPEPQTASVPAFAIGDRVKHKAYGRVGTITAIVCGLYTLEYDHGDGVTTIGNHWADELEAAD